MQDVFSIPIFITQYSKYFNASYKAYLQLLFWANVTNLFFSAYKEFFFSNYFWDAGFFDKFSLIDVEIIDLVWEDKQRRFGIAQTYTSQSCSRNH